MYFSLYFVLGKSDPQEYAVTKKVAIIFIRWFETVSENFKRLKMLSESKCSESFLNDFS